MSSKKKKWNDGEAVTVPELQRAADAAYAVDRAAVRNYSGGDAVVVGATTLYKSVLPLERLPALAGAGTAGRGIEYLGYKTAPGTIPGGVNIKPAQYQISVQAPQDPTLLSTGDDPKMVAEQTSGTLVQGFADTGGAPRTDLVYARIRNVTTSTIPRKHKSTTGVVSTQNIPIEESVIVDFGIVAGSLVVPADDIAGGVYYIGLLEVTIPAASFPQTVGLPAGATVKQVWRRTGHSPELIRSMRETNFAPNGTATAAEALAKQWLGTTKFIKAVRLTAATGAGGVNRVQIDDSIDWRYRLARITVVLGTDHVDFDAGQAALLALVTHFPNPSEIIIGGQLNTSTSNYSWDSGWFFTGDGTADASGTLAPYALVRTPTNHFRLATALWAGSINFWMGSDRKLKFTAEGAFPGGLDAAGAMFTFVIEVSDQFKVVQV